MKRSLLVLGGGPFAIPAVQWAREAGLSAILADPDPHAPARRAAGEFHAIPRDDAEAHVALARRLDRTAGEQGGALAGILAAEPRALPLLAALSAAVSGLLPSRRALERLLDADSTRSFLRSQGFSIAEPTRGTNELDLWAFFRDGAFVPGGLAARRTLPGGDVLSLQPSHLAPERAHAAYVLVERAARALELERGPLQATLVDGEAGLMLVTLVPGFADALGALHVTRLVHGKSPLQAWLAHLAGAGGPFDELCLEPRAAAGWLAIAAERPGLFAGVDGLARASALPGLAGLWIEEPGRVLAPPEIEELPLGYLWAVGSDRSELEARLLAARAALDVRVAQRQHVA